MTTVYYTQVASFVGRKLILDKIANLFKNLSETASQQILQKESWHD